jgi:hypothetical protein
MGSVRGGWRKLNIEELQNLNSLPSVIRMTESSRVRWTGYVAHLGISGIHIGF